MLTDRIGTGLLLASIVGVIAAGLAARPTVVSETEDTERNAEAFRNLVLHTGNPELIRNLETANTVRLREDYFRTCIARDDRRRYFCAFVDTSTDPAQVTRDSSAEPNSIYRPAPVSYGRPCGSQRSVRTRGSESSARASSHAAAGSPPGRSSERVAPRRRSTRAAASARSPAAR